MKREAKIKQGRAGSSSYNKIICRYRVACMISLLYLACMVHACVYLVLFLSFSLVLLSVTVIFSLALPFLGSNGVMGSLLLG